MSLAPYFQLNFVVFTDVSSDFMRSPQVSLGIQHSKATYDSLINPQNSIAKPPGIWISVGALKSALLPRVSWSVYTLERLSFLVLSQVMLRLEIL